jgi:RNA polymerase sigma-70 factor (ECF subfamily)
MKGDLRKEKFITLINTHENIIHKVCSVYANNSADREDLKQEIIFQLWKSFPSFRSEAKIQTWMYKVALNTALIGLRKKNRVVQTELQDNHAEPIDQNESDELRYKINELYDAIHKLNQVEKAVLFLYLEKCSYREISDITGLTEKNVSVLLFRSKEKLRNLMGKPKTILK